MEGSFNDHDPETNAGHPTDKQLQRNQSSQLAIKDTRKGSSGKNQALDREQQHPIKIPMRIQIQQANT
jgi:hypothetical protein